MLRDLFQQPPLIRDTREKVVDTSKAIRALRVAVTEHMDQKGPAFHEAKQLLHMLNNTGFHDPGEAWNLLYSVVREEHGVTAQNSLIGISAKETLTCTTCGTIRDSDLSSGRYIFQALQLNTLTTAKNPSVQEAIQVFFSPEEDVPVRCANIHCEGKDNSLPHTKFTECHKGGSGLVFYGPFDAQGRQKYRHTRFQVDDEVRVPLQGPSSGYQSAYDLVGFIAFFIERAHHVAVLYDAKGQPWTFDDQTIKKGLPDSKWIPVLMFYRLWQEQTATSDVEFSGPVSHTYKAGHTHPETLSDEDNSESSGSSPPSPQGSTTRSGRNSQPTNFYRPHGNLSKKQKAEKNNKSHSSNQSSASTGALPHPRSPQSQTQQPDRETPTSPEQSQPSTTRQRSRSTAGNEVANEKASAFPANKLAWVRYDDSSHRSIPQGSYVVARILGTASRAYMNIAWLVESIEPKKVKVNNKRLLRLLEPREEELFLRLTHEQEKLTLTRMSDLLNSRCPLRRSTTVSTTHTDGEENLGDVLSQLVITDATSNWCSRALPWLLGSECCFDPTALCGLPFSVPPSVPSECFKPNQEFPAHPSFGNCLREIMLVASQLDKDSIMYGRVFAWMHLLPILLLRAHTSSCQKSLKKLISRRCQAFLEGEWEMLYTQTLKDADKLTKPRDNTASRLPTSDATKIKQGIQYIRSGNLSKGVRTIVGEGISKDPHALTEMKAKHPQEAPCATFPEGYAPEPLSEHDEGQVEWHLTTRNLARIAGAFPAQSQPDQWGWRSREYIAPLLHAPGLGDLMVEVLIMPRHLGTMPDMYGECFRGGKLIALSKAPKPGSRPIAIGDAFRRLLDKALQLLSKKDLAGRFEHAYPNVKQFASGSSDGAEKFIVTAMLALQEHPAPQDIQLPLHDDPMCILLLDTQNAFNTISRQAVFDMITRQFDRTYAKGRLTSANTTVLPSIFSAHFASIKGHYERDGHLAFVDADRKLHHVTSRTGVHQGCVMGGKLFNIGTLSVVGATMADHANVFCPMFSDNIALVGNLSKVFAAADDLRESLLEIDLQLQPAESVLYIPSYIQQVEPPPRLASLRDEFPAFKDVPWAKEGIKLLGCPLGTDQYVRTCLAQVCDGIARRSSQLSVVNDGLIHLQLHKFCVNTMLPYFLRTTSPALTAEFAQQIDRLIWTALLDFSEVPDEDRNDVLFQQSYDDGRCQIGLPISQGGFGITPNECVATPAFYKALSQSLSFAADTDFKPLRDYVASQAFRSHPLWTAYVEARQYLLGCGAVEPEPPDAESQQSQQAPAHALPPRAAPTDGPNRAKHAKKPQPPVLPILDDVLSSDRAAQLRFPAQRTLTRLVQKAHPRWSSNSLSEEGKTRTEHLSRQTLKPYAEAGDTATYLQEIAKFDKEQEIRHSPLGFLAHTESLSENYPRDLFAVILTYLLGLPAPRCLQNRGALTCEACGQPLDRFGHHRMTCNQTASFNAAHRHLASAFAETAKLSGVPLIDKNVPSHLTTNKVGDALCLLSNDSRRLILDYTVIHPRSGTANTAGQWNPSAVENKARDKWNRHGKQYAVIGFAFAPCVATTYGHLHAHLLRLLYIFAKKRAELVHTNERPLVDIDFLFGIYFTQGRARIGAALARGMALRALGCSITGVSKVFLRHIAPTRLLRDQTLSAGQHFVPGHAQWRLILDA